MTENKYPLYGFLIVAGAVVAVWAGLPPTFLILLACPLMMFFMMRGMHGNTMDHSSTKNAEAPGRDEMTVRTDSETGTAPDHTNV